MKTEKEGKASMLLAITEHDSPVNLWRSAIQKLGETDRELTVLFVADERWLHAAALPFTCEVCAVSGRLAAFTRQRADEIIRESATEARREFERLAMEAKLSLKFEIAPATGAPDVRRFFGTTRIIVVASSRFLRCSAYAAFSELRPEWVLIDEAETI